MHRRVVPLAMLFAAAAAFGGIAAAQADEAPPPRKRAPPAQSKSPREPLGKRCQENSDCSVNQVCKTVGDHKECQASPRPIPVPT